MSAKEILKGKLLGFSLLELMVVVAILGVLATVAVPRFNIFRARSRQAEAKSNMGVIFTLQESFQIEHEKYYDGKKTTWGGEDMVTHTDNSKGAGYAVAGTIAGSCKANKLGFRLANCGAARYAYMIGHAVTDTAFLAIAHAYSDGAEGKRIFPGCAGSHTAPNKPKTLRGAASAITAAKRCAHDGANTDRSVGDAWCIDEGRTLFNYRDIVEFCEG